MRVERFALITFGLSLVLPWWHAGSGGYEGEPQFDGGVAFPLVGWSGGFEGYNEYPEIWLPSLALWAAGFIWLWWTVRNGRAGQATAAAPLALFFTMFLALALAVEIGERRDGPAMELGIGAWVALLACLALICRLAWRRGMSPQWIAAGLAILALHAAPLLQTHVTIDPANTYFGEPGEPFDTPMTFMAWMRSSEAHPTGNWHPWWDNFYLGKDANWGIYAAGVILAATSLVGLASMFWRHNFLRRAAVGGVALTLLLHCIGAAGELSTDEYLAHGEVWLAWGWLLAAFIAWAWWRDDPSLGAKNTEAA